MAFKSLRAAQTDDTADGLSSRTIPEIGRLRMGEKVETKNGKQAPAVADGWIITTRERGIADIVAQHFGEPVAPYAGKNSSDRYQVHTGRTTLPVMLAPGNNTDTMAIYERFTGRGQERTCTWTPSGRQSTVFIDGPFGRTPVLSPCVCEQARDAGVKVDPNDETTGGFCQPKLRLQVLLDIPGIPVVGSFQLTSKSEAACEQIPGIIGLIQQASGGDGTGVQADLRMEPRSSATRRYTVPVLTIRASQEALVAAVARSISPPGPHPDTDIAALNAAPLPPVELVDRHIVDGWRDEIKGLTDEARADIADHLRGLGVDLRGNVPVEHADAIAELIAGFTPGRSTQ